MAYINTYTCVTIIATKNAIYQVKCAFIHIQINMYVLCTLYTFPTPSVPVVITIVCYPLLLKQYIPTEMSHESFFLQQMT